MMAERLVVHPVYGQAWFWSPCATDALVQAATEWDASFAELLDAWRKKEVRVMIRRADDGQTTDL